DMARTGWIKHKAERIRTRAHGVVGIFVAGNTANFDSRARHSLVFLMQNERVTGCLNGQGAESNKFIQEWRCVDGKQRSPGHMSFRSKGRLRVRQTKVRG